jgi:hypothetical protein
MLPQLPTDNLYKFMTIGGLALIVTSVIALKLEFDATDSLTELAIETSAIQSEIDTFLSQQKDFEQLSDFVRSDRNTGDQKKPTDERTRPLSERIESLKIHIDEARQRHRETAHQTDSILLLYSVFPSLEDAKAKAIWLRMTKMTDSELNDAITNSSKDTRLSQMIQQARDLRVKLARLEYLNIEINYRIERALSIYNLSKIGVWVGSGLFAFSIVTWYRNVQKYLDLAIKEGKYFK